MIDPLYLLTVPSAIAIAALLIAAIFYDLTVFRRRKNKNRAIYRCKKCRHIYTTWTRTPLAKCPQCGTQNEPVR